MAMKLATTVRLIITLLTCSGLVLGAPAIAGVAYYPDPAPNPPAFANITLDNMGDSPSVYISPFSVYVTGSDFVSSLTVTMNSSQQSATRTWMKNQNEDGGELDYQVIYHTCKDEFETPASGTINFTTDTSSDANVATCTAGNHTCVISNAYANDYSCSPNGGNDGKLQFKRVSRSSMPTAGNYTGEITFTLSMT